MSNDNFLQTLEETIRDRLANPQHESYTSSLASMGVNRVAQKVGEEAVELAIAAVNGSDSDVLNEGADLLYHVLVLLHVRDMNWNDLVTTLESRHTG